VRVRPRWKLKWTTTSNLALSRSNPGDKVDGGMGQVNCRRRAEPTTHPCGGCPAPDTAQLRGCFPRVLLLLVVVVALLSLARYWRYYNCEPKTTINEFGRHLVSSRRRKTKRRHDNASWATKERKRRRALACSYFLLARPGRSLGLLLSGTVLST